MASPSQDVSFFEAGRRALQGDPVMVREVLAAIGAFSVRLAVAAVILAVTFWAARKLANLSGALWVACPTTTTPATRH